MTSGSKYRDSNRIMRHVVKMLEESGPMAGHEIRARLYLYSARVVNSGLNYMLLNNKLTERSDGRLTLK